MVFKAPEHRVELKFPAAPKASQLPVPTAQGIIPGVSYMSEHADECFALNVITFPESMQVDVERGLDGARDGMINDINGRIVSEEHSEVYGHPGRTFVAQASDGGVSMRIEARLFWVSHRMYQLLVVAREGSTSGMADKFFANFRLLEP